MRLPFLSAPLLSALLFAAPLAAQKTPPKTPVKAPAAKDTAAKAKTPAPVPEVPKYGFLQGVAIDSVHEEPLVGALIQVEGTGRIGPTDSLGRFLIDSILPGSYRLIVDHPLLDTLGITLVTPAMPFAVNTTPAMTITSADSAGSAATSTTNRFFTALSPGRLEAA